MLDAFDKKNAARAGLRFAATTIVRR